MQKGYEYQRSDYGYKQPSYGGYKKSRGYGQTGYGNNGYKQTAYASGYYDSYGYTQRYPEYSSYYKYTFYPYSGYHYKGKYGSSYQPLTHLNDYDPGVKNYREYLRYKDYYGKSKYHRPTIHIN